MAKTKEESPDKIYIAANSRAEVIGPVKKGDLVDLSWLSDEEKAFVLLRAYYVPTNWALVPLNVADLYEAMR